jgi:two-component system KDP operon response regulator KdpE
MNPVSAIGNTTGGSTVLPAVNAGERILLIEDDAYIREFVLSALEAAGYQVIEAASARWGASEAAKHLPHLILLDLGLPDRDGVEFIRDYRGWSATPILIISARIEEKQKVAALDAGADDYLTKPFGVPELLARVRALLRRAPPPRLESNPLICFDGFCIDCVNRNVSKDGVPIKLSQIEYRLLLAMAGNPGRVLTHRQLLIQVWGSQAADNHEYLRVYVGHLRQKIETNPAQPRYILTEIGVGYRFQP